MMTPYIESMRVEEYNIILGCLSNDDISSHRVSGDKNRIVVEPYAENYSRITGVKKFNYYIYEQTGKLKLYSATNIPSELRILSQSKMDIISDINSQCELSKAKKMLAIASITSRTYNTITLYDLLILNDIKFNDIVNIYVSKDVNVSKVIEDIRLNNYTLSINNRNQPGRFNTVHSSQ